MISGSFLFVQVTVPLCVFVFVLGVGISPWWFLGVCLSFLSVALCVHVGGFGFCWLQFASRDCGAGRGGPRVREELLPQESSARALFPLLGQQLLDHANDHNWKTFFLLLVQYFSCETRLLTRPLGVKSLPDKKSSETLANFSKDSLIPWELVR